MTKKITISLPDDVVAELEGVGNVSGHITAALREQVRRRQVADYFAALGVPEVAPEVRSRIRARFREQLYGHKVTVALDPAYVRRAEQRRQGLIDGQASDAA